MFFKAPLEPFHLNWPASLASLLILCLARSKLNLPNWFVVTVLWRWQWWWWYSFGWAEVTVNPSEDNPGIVDNVGQCGAWIKKIYLHHTKFFVCNHQQIMTAMAIFFLIRRKMMMITMHWWWRRWWWWASSFWLLISMIVLEEGLPAV